MHGDRTPDRYVELHAGYARALALKEARRLPSHLDVEELIQLALIGLMEAARSFEEGRGCSFTTFAYPRIRGAILDGARRIQGLRKRAVRDIGQRYLENDYVHHTTSLGLTRLSAEESAGILSRAAAGLGVIFLASHMHDPEHPEDPTTESAAVLAERSDLYQRVRDTCEELPPRQRRVIEMLYLEELSTTECARRLGVNKAQVSRDHAKAIDQLRRVLNPASAAA